MKRMRETVSHSMQTVLGWPDWRRAESLTDCGRTVGNWLVGEHPTTPFRAASPSAENLEMLDILGRANMNGGAFTIDSALPTETSLARVTLVVSPEREALIRESALAHDCAVVTTALKRSEKLYANAVIESPHVRVASSPQAFSSFDSATLTTECFSLPRLRDLNLPAGLPNSLRKELSGALLMVVVDKTGGLDGLREVFRKSLDRQAVTAG